MVAMKIMMTDYVKLEHLLHSYQLIIISIRKKASCIILFVFKIEVIIIGMVLIVYLCCFLEYWC